VLKGKNDTFTTTLSQGSQPMKFRKPLLKFACKKNEKHVKGKLAITNDVAENKAYILNWRKYIERTEEDGMLTIEYECNFLRCGFPRCVFEIHNEWNTIFQRTALLQLL